MPETMLLIPGRSTRQGTSLNKGKLGEEYQQVTSTVEINAEEMGRLGFDDGDRLRLRNHIGEVEVTCVVPKKATDLPPGMIFIAYGPTSSRLMEGDTAGSGMPLSKHIPVEVEKIG